jgi:hypothetical protein
MFQANRNRSLRRLVSFYRFCADHVGADLSAKTSLNSRLPLRLATIEFAVQKRCRTD